MSKRSQKPVNLVTVSYGINDIQNPDWTARIQKIFDESNADIVAYIASKRQANTIIYSNGEYEQSVHEYHSLLDTCKAIWFRIEDRFRNEFSDELEQAVTAHLDALDKPPIRSDDPPKRRMRRRWEKLERKHEEVPSEEDDLSTLPSEAQYEFELANDAREAIWEEATSPRRTAYDNHHLPYIYGLMCEVMGAPVKLAPSTTINAEGASIGTHGTSKPRTL